MEDIRLRRKTRLAKSVDDLPEPETPDPGFDEEPVNIDDIVTVIDPKTKEYVYHPKTLDELKRLHAYGINPAYIVFCLAPLLELIQRLEAIEDFIKDSQRFLDKKC